jgi:hypothetical protein
VDTVSDYQGLVGLLRRRRVELGLSQLEIDDIAGFQSGYCSKLEQPSRDYGRQARWPTLEWWLGALGVGLALVPLGHQQTFQSSSPAPFLPPERDQAGNGKPGHTQDKRAHGPMSATTARKTVTT